MYNFGAVTLSKQ